MGTFCGGTQTVSDPVPTPGTTLEKHVETYTSKEYKEDEKKAIVQIQAYFRQKLALKDQEEYGRIRARFVKDPNLIFKPELTLEDGSVFCGQVKPTLISEEVDAALKEG